MYYIILVITGHIAYDRNTYKSYFNLTWESVVSDHIQLRQRGLVSRERLSRACFNAWTVATVGTPQKPMHRYIMYVKYTVVKECQMVRM